MAIERRGIQKTATGQKKLLTPEEISPRRICLVVMNILLSNYNSRQKPEMLDV
jgi:hypothetical protein